MRILHRSSTRRLAAIRARSLRSALGLLALAVVSGCAAMPEGVLDSEAWQPTAPDMLLPEAPANGAIYQSGQDIRLFENSVARRVGDTLTIRLVENMNAAKSSSTATSKSTGVELLGPTIAGRPVTANGVEILNNSLESDKSFSGEGSSRQSNSLFGDITVTVAQRWPNGNLLVRGEKWITINQGREFVRVSGIVRSVDISPDNSVLSTKIANARISYAGRGAINDANSPGLLSRFFNLPWLPL
jgi:flagellar L-ring protein FlgH